MMMMMMMMMMMLVELMVLQQIQACASQRLSGAGWRRLTCSG
jgi:hypothetical protein